MQAIAYIGLGSNLGDKIHNCRQALQELVSRGCLLVNRSSWYQTQPWGFEEQDWFVNGVAEVRTDLAPHELLSTCKEIEARLGRQENGRWGPRAIDIDILFYNNLMLSLPNLEIPHPRLHQRNFVLIPLLEIAPQVLHPVLKQSVCQLASTVRDTKEVLKIAE